MQIGHQNFVLAAAIQSLFYQGRDSLHFGRTRLEFTVVNGECRIRRGVVCE